MTVTVEKGKARGTVTAPPSKSMAHRALICAALSGGGKVCNIEYSDDITATLDCLEALGADVERNSGYVNIGKFDLGNITEKIILPCRESGSTLRFMIPICMTLGKSVTLKGEKRLLERPLGIYENICREQKIDFIRDSESLTVCGKLNSGDFYVAGNISSQFISGLMFVLPLLEGNSRIILEGKIESRSYIIMTLDVLHDFGIRADMKDNIIFISGSQKYKSTDYTVEGDCSNAAFLDAFNLAGGDVSVVGIKDDSLQGDKVYKKMFAELKDGKKNFDLSDCPDLAPVMFAVSALFGGADFTGTARLKYKESDRVASMAEELAKFGVSVDSRENSVSVRCENLKAPTEVLCGHNDHRVVMSLAVLCSITGGTVSGAQAVKKSFPDFFFKISKLGIRIVKNET